VEEPVLDRIVDGILAIVTSVPAWFVAEDSPHFMLVRAMFALLLIVLVVCAIAFLPSRAAIGRCMRKASNLILRK
jgi:hypothetical protein